MVKIFSGNVSLFEIRSHTCILWLSVYFNTSVLYVVLSPARSTMSCRQKTMYSCLNLWSKCQTFSPLKNVWQQWKITSNIACVTLVSHNHPRPLGSLGLVHKGEGLATPDYCDTWLWSNISRPSFTWRGMMVWGRD